MSVSGQSMYHVFPRSTNYDPVWVKSNSMGENVLFNLESLMQVMPLQKEMRVLDLACGKAISAIFMVKEFEVEVWAVDEAVSATDNFTRIQESACSHKVFPIQADARNLPFAENYFDAIVVIDSYTYFGTDDKYLPYLAKFVKPEGLIGIVDVAFTQEIETFEQVPDFLKADYSRYWYYVHSAEWWKKLWERTGLVEVVCAENLPGEQVQFIKEQYIQDYKNKKNEPFARALQEDKEGLITFFRLVGRRTPKAAYLQEYAKK
ncbi:class I SAM-dependent methyltransferase [Rhodocytophaga aerolata]|uniref:Class I SAM-dependent methyltransferase n=1 Tax=Rhodocytophaga aerolata TaxID=455078 RepID=A0ABT8RAH8_9BACT|nr:class I SAM-dependent methyltransferase [Rhodocytophaga aerolata]MDO1447762.1 class I SAM-dependent methyltransferase [Rhodocytophaga aerolata]